MSLPDEVYARLLSLRNGLRHFERWSEQQARAAGLTPAQHQLLLAIRGRNDPRGPTIGEVADDLCLRHHSTVGLIDRADAAGLVSRTRDEADHRVVRLDLTATGAERLEALSSLHLEEIERLAPQFRDASDGLGPVLGNRNVSGALSSTAPKAGPAQVTIARVYDRVNVDPSHSVLVDRLWPRGLNRSAAPFDTWAKDVAPSAALRKWYGHQPERFEEFARRYSQELTGGSAREAFEALHRRAIESHTLLLTATKDIEGSGAAVLKNLLSTG